MVLVDNSKRSFWLQPSNGLLVSDWEGTNFSDNELDRVKDELKMLMEAKDVRPRLKRSLRSSDTDKLILLLMAIVGLWLWYMAQ